MSIYPNETEQDLTFCYEILLSNSKINELSKVKRQLKQTHDIKLAESLSPITLKLDTVNESTKILGDMIKESNSEIENDQEIVPVEINPDNSEADKIKPNIRALPNKPFLVN